MTTTYTGSNIGLEYDAATGTWGYKNIAQDFIDTNTFSTADPSFEYVPVEEDDEDEQDNSTVCPPGYIYDETLKQCMPDPNAQSNFLGEQDSGQPDQPGLVIPSNEIKEDWIKNKDVAVYENGTKTGLQMYIDNLDDRGFTKIVDGKIIFEKDIGGSPIYQGVANILGHQAKVDKIVQDLQRMGAINAEVNLNEKGDMVYTSEMELSDIAGVFPTYNYDETGEYTGFTTPKGKTFTKTGTFGTAGYESAWEKYMNEMAKVQTSVTTPVVTLTSPKQIGAYTGGVDYEEQSALLDNQVKEEQLKQEAIETKKKEKEYQDTFGDSGGEFVTTPKKDTKPKAPPGQPETGPHIGYGGGGTSLGSSVHGTGSYTPPKSSPVTSGPKPGKKGWKR